LFFLDVDFSRYSKEWEKSTLKDDLRRIATNRDPTAELYNKGHAMRYELENHHQQRLRELTPKMNIK
jgi:hypothetical protein